MKFQALEGLTISSFKRVEIKRKSRWFKHLTQKLFWFQVHQSFWHIWLPMSSRIRGPVYWWPRESRAVLPIVFCRLLPWPRDLFNWVWRCQSLQVRFFANTCKELMWSNHLIMNYKSTNFLNEYLLSFLFKLLKNGKFVEKISENKIRCLVAWWQRCLSGLVQL